MKKTIKERRRASALDKLNWLVEESLSISVSLTKDMDGKDDQIRLFVTHIDEPTKSFAVLAKDVPTAIMIASQKALEEWLD